MYPRPDRSNFKPNFSKTADNDQVDVGWNEGVLSDGRPYRLECWAQDQLTVVTVFVSRLGLENATGSQLADLLSRERVVWFKPSIEPHADVARLPDASGNAMWSINIVIGVGSRPPHADSVPLKPYAKPPAVGQR